MTENKSRVRQGILKLTNLKKGDKSPKNTKVQRFKQEPDDSKPKPMKLLSDADLHVKNLLSNYLLTLDIEDPKQFDIESKIKILNEQKAKGPNIKLIDLSDDEDVSWGKSKSKVSQKKNLSKPSQKPMSKKNTSSFHLEKQNTDKLKSVERSMTDSEFLNDSSDLSDVSYYQNEEKNKSKEIDEEVYRSFKTFKANSRVEYGIKANIDSNRKPTDKIGKENSLKSNQNNHHININNKSYKSDRLKKSSSIIIDDQYNDDESDIRNILPMSKKNFNEFNGICSKIQQSICIQPQKPAFESSKSMSKKSYAVNSDEEEGDSKKKTEFHFRVLSRAHLVYDSLSDEESDQEITETYYLEPTSFLRLLYDCLLIALFVYSAFSTPFALAFELNHTRRITFDFIMNIFIDLFFGLDLFLSFFTAYYNFDEQLVTDINSIAYNYLMSWFALDLISGIPYYCIIEFYCLSHPLAKITISTRNIFKSESLALVNLLKLFRLFKGVKILSENSFITYIKQILVELNLVSKWFRLYMTLLLFLFSTHLLSCVFIFFGFNYYPNWIIDQKLDPKDEFDIYIASVYFIFLTIYSVGYGDIKTISLPERIFNLILLVVGIVIYSWTVSSLSRYYIDGDEKTMEFRRKNDLLQDIKINYETMSTELFDKIQRFLHYQMNNEKIDSNDILEGLPIGLKNNLISEMYKPIIENFVFFKNFDSTDFKIKVILSLKPMLAIKNERLVNDGDVMEEIFFVKNGKLILEFPLPIVLSPELAKVIDKNSLSLHPVGTIKEQLTLAMVRSNNYTLDDFDFKKQKERKKSISTSIMPEIKQQYVKIIDICRNEHFGDVLMFLNQRSPLRVRVKSQKAELFLLKKTDAVEISMSFPKIWRKIIRKSLFNMQQINRLINKSLKFFFSHYEGKDRMKLPQEGEPLTKGAKNTYFKQTITFDGMYNTKDDDELKTIPSDHRSMKTLQVISEVLSSKQSSTEPLAKLIPCQEETIKNMNEISSVLKEVSLISNTNGSNRTVSANICNQKVQIQNSSKSHFKPDDFLFKDNDNSLENTYSYLLYKEDDINSEYYPNEGKLKHNILYTRENSSNANAYPNLNAIDINYNPISFLNEHNDKKQTESIVYFDDNKENNRLFQIKEMKEKEKEEEGIQIIDKNTVLTTKINKQFTTDNAKTYMTTQTLNKTIKIINHQFSRIDKCDEIVFSLIDNNNSNKEQEIDKLEPSCQSRESTLIYQPTSNNKNRRNSNLEKSLFMNNNNNKYTKVRTSEKFGGTVLSPSFSPQILGEPLNLRARKQSVNYEISRNTNLLQMKTSVTGQNQSIKKGSNAKKLNMITTNIQNNSLMLNHPVMFYSSLFSQVIGKEKERDETKGLNKKLNEIMKLIQDNETD